MVCFERLNPTAIIAFVVVVAVDVVGEEFEENMFGVKASIEESSSALVIKSYFDSCFSIYMCRSTSMVVHPWRLVSKRGFFCKIKIERVFSLASLLIALRHYCLHVENMDRIIIMVKNWPDDPCHNYKPNVDLKENLKNEDCLIKENYDLLEEADFFK